MKLRKQLDKEDLNTMSNPIFLNNKLMNLSQPQTNLPSITLKLYLKKTPRPEHIRYAAHNEILDYDEMLISRPLKFMKKNSVQPRLKTSKITLDPIRKKAKTVSSETILLSPSVRGMRDSKMLQAKVEELRLTIKKTTPEPRSVNVHFLKGDSIAMVFEEIEPDLTIDYEKVKYKKIELPDVMPIRPNLSKVQQKDDYKFQLIQESINYL